MYSLKLHDEVSIFFSVFLTDEPGTKFNQSWLCISEVIDSGTARFVL
jgi:hypothetical protein